MLPVASVTASVGVS